MQNHALNLYLRCYCFQLFLCSQDRSATEGSFIPLSWPWVISPSVLSFCHFLLLFMCFPCVSLCVSVFIEFLCLASFFVFHS